MRKIIVIIILLIAIPFCLVVWAGLDSAGGSLINCPAIVSDTTDFSISISGTADVATIDSSGQFNCQDILIEKASPDIRLKNTGSDETLPRLRFAHGETNRASIAWHESVEELRILSAGTIYFGESALIDPVVDKLILGRPDSNDYRVNVKGGGYVNDAAFTGSGLDDMTPSGTYDGTSATNITYKVEIDATGTPDTFKWSDDAGLTWNVTGVAITGGVHTLNDGITVTFDATEGHTIGDYWLFIVTVFSPMWLQDAAGDGILYVGNDSQVGILTENPSAVLDVVGDIESTSITTTGGGITGTFASVLADNIYLEQQAPSSDRLVIKPLDFSITDDRILSIDVDDAARILRLGGDVYANQNVDTAASPTFGGLIVNTDSYRVTTAKTPTSSADTGTQGDICWDTDYIYVAVANDTWKRVELTAWGIPGETVIYAGEDVIYAGEDVVYP